MKWMDGEELLDTVKDFCEVIAGSAMNESAKALGFSAMANGTLIKPVVNTTATQIIQFPGATAAEAYAVGGTVATGAATSTAANLTLVNTTAGATAAGSSSVAGVLSVAAPIALSALAAVGGFLIGNELYEHNQEFFDELTGPLMSRLADGTVNMMGLFDKEGNTYLDKKAYEILMEKLNSIPSILVDNFPTNDTDLNNLKPTCSLYLAAYEGFNWGFENCSTFKNNSQKTGFNYNCALEGVRKSIEYLESQFPNKLKCIIFDSYYYSGANPSVNGYIVNGITFNYWVFDDFNIFSIFTKHDSTYNVDYKALNAKAAFYYGSYTPSTFDREAYGNTTIFTTEDPIYGTIYYYISSSGHDTTYSSRVFDLESYGGYAPRANNFCSIEKSNLPAGVKKYNPTIAKVDPIYLVRGWDADGCPVEVPYIPVRLPSNPSEMPIPNEKDDPSGDPKKNPNIVTPYIPTEVPYPSGTPIVAPKPAPTPEENPDNLPYVRSNISLKSNIP